MERESNPRDELREIIIKSQQDFPTFVKFIFPCSFKKGKFKPAKHILEWARRIQENKRTATLSARRHLKSTLMHAYIMWRLFISTDDEKWLYMSYTSPLSAYHTSEIKKYIRNNPFFRGIKDLSHSDTIIKYEREGYTFSCTPASILRFNRGWHGYGVVCDDILNDPTNELNYATIETVNRAFFEEVLSLPIEGGECHVVGTAQHQEDLFFKLKDNKTFNWDMYTAIINEKDQEVLWPENFPYERLVELREEELGEKAFSKEYMCMPVWSAESFFTRKQVMDVVDKDLKPEVIKTRGTFVAGLDIGKHAHPSHLAVFRVLDGKYTMIYQEFFDNCQYIDQVNKINELIEFYGIDSLCYDATRGELEAFVEQQIIDKRIWKPVNFGVKSKHEMAANFEKVVSNKTIKLLNNERMIKQILQVNNDLDAIETVDGHGDAFWSISLALKKSRQYRPFIAV